MAEKITIAMKFAATIALLKDEATEIDWDTDQAIEFLEDRAEKAAHKSDKPRKRKTDPEVEDFRKEVATFLSEQDEPVTAKEVAEALSVPGAESKETGKVSTQKASAALRWLVSEGIATVYEGEKSRDNKSYEIVR